MLVLPWDFQAIDASLDQAVSELLGELAKFQTKLYEKDPVKAAQKRRYQCGLREVLKAARRGKLKLAVIAPNIDKIETDGGLDDMVVEVAGHQKPQPDGVEGHSSLPRKWNPNGICTQPYKTGQGGWQQAQNFSNRSAQSRWGAHSVQKSAELDSRSAGNVASHKANTTATQFRIPI